MNLQNFGVNAAHNANIGGSQRRMQQNFVSAAVPNNDGLSATHEFAVYTDASNLAIDQYVLLESNPTGPNPTIQHLSIPGNFGLAVFRIANIAGNVITLQRVDDSMCDNASSVAALYSPSGCSKPLWRSSNQSLLHHSGCCGWPRPSSFPHSNPNATRPHPCQRPSNDSIGCRRGTWCTKHATSSSTS